MTPIVRARATRPRSGAAPRRPATRWRGRTAVARRRWSVARGALAGLAVLGLGLVRHAPPVRAQAPGTAEVLVDARVLPDGRVAITVDRAVAFAAASEAPMSLAIPLDGASGIEIMEVGEPGRHYEAGDDPAPFVYTEAREQGGTTVHWGIAATPGETRRFIVTYLLSGAIDVDPRGDALARTLLAPDGAPVASAVVRVSVPPTAQAIITADARRVPGDTALSVDRRGDTAIEATATALGPDEGIAVRVAWPTGAVAGTPRAAQAPALGGVEGTRPPRSAAASVAPSLLIARGHWPALAIAFGLLGAIVAVGAVFGAALGLQSLRAARAGSDR